MTNSNALIKFTEQRIGSNQQLQSFVQEARKVANVIFPETLSFSDNYCKLGAEVVTVDLRNERDVYKNESGGYSLHLSKLNEIAKAAKIRVTDSRILERKVDETGRVVFISHQVKVAYRTVSNEMISESFTGKYDYYNDKATKKDGQVKSRRKHAEALAESNALYRAFNKVLPQLGSSFKIDELQKPFLVPYVEDDKDALLKELPTEEQAAIKRELARKRLGVADQIYGGVPSRSKTSEPEITEAVVMEDEQPKTQSSGNKTPPPNKVNTTAPGITPEEENRMNAETFRDAPQKERTEKILALIKEKDHKHPDGAEYTAAMIEKATIDKQIDFIEKLLNLPGKEAELI